MPRDADDLLRDIREACRRIAGYVEGHDLQTFTSDDRTIRAVLYDLVVVGEAAKGVDDATRAAHPNVPWKEMAGLPGTSPCTSTTESCSIWCGTPPLDESPACLHRSEDETGVAVAGTRKSQDAQTTRVRSPARGGAPAEGR